MLDARPAAHRRAGRDQPSPYSRAYTPPCRTSCSCRPCSTMRPASNTQTRSASFTADSRWATISIVRPASRRRSAARCRWFGCSEKRWPRISTVPSPNGSNQTKHRSKVDLPAPFEQTRAIRSPRRAEKSTASRTREPVLNCLPRPRASSTIGGQLPCVTWSKGARTCAPAPTHTCSFNCRRSR